MKKTVFRVDIHCDKCKTKVLKTVSKLEGINSVAVDGEKRTLTVIGDVDPVQVAKALRKAGRVAQIESVGPPKPPEPQKFPICYKDYHHVGYYVPVMPYEGGQTCSIL